MHTNDPFFKTADLSDNHTNIQICEPGLKAYGGKRVIHGPIRTVKCFEDNSLVRDYLLIPGEGAVLVVDAGGSMRCAMLGDMLAAKAVENGWSAIVLYGCVRDSADIARMPLGVWALGTFPKKSHKQGIGEKDLTVHFYGVTFYPGEYLYADDDGIIVANKMLI